MDLKKLHMFRYSLLLLIFLSCIGIVSAATITVGDSGQDYSTISDAVTAANPGDVILVSDGTYTETVTVSKELTISSVNGSSSTLVQSSGNTVFTISASNVTIEGFNITGASTFTQAGTKLSSSASNCNITDNQLNGNYYGIYLNSASNNTLTNNNASSNNQAGIYLYSASNYNILTSNTASSNTNYGIYLSSTCNYNTLTSNNANSNSQDGISLSSSSNNTLSNNTASSNTYSGIDLYSASNYNTLTSNTASNNGQSGISLHDSSNNTLSNNTASSNNDYGIFLYYSSNNTLSNNTASDNEYGILLYSSSNNTLSNNTASSNTNYGIFLHDASNYNTLISNNASSNSHGIFLSSSNNTLSNNTASSNNQHGIYLSHSSNSTLTNNLMSSNSYNFGVYGSDLEDGSDLEEFLHDIDQTNLVDGKPLYYWTNRSNEEVPSDAGAVCLINSNNITVRDIELSNLHSGVMLAYTNNSTIQNVTASGNRCGINLYFSNFNTLNDITAIDNYVHGIFLYSSSNNTLTSNNASNNGQSGISLDDSSNNTLTNNTCTYDMVGIFVESSNNALRDNTASFNEYGIVVADSSNITLSDNTASSNTNYGIFLYFYASNNTLSNTTAINNSVYDLNADSTSHDNIIENLVLTNNFTEISFISDPGTKVKGLETVAATVSGKTSTNRYVTIVNSSASPMNFTFYYNDSGMSITDESFVALYRLNDSEWLAVSATSLNTTGNYVSANLTEFGTFGLFKSNESSIPSSSSTPSSSSSSSSGGSVASRVISQGTVEQLSLGEDGEIMGDTVVKSYDTKATLTLYKGTVALDPYGNPVNKVMITVPASMPADVPADMTYSGLYYEFGPSGTTVSEDIMVSIDFDPEEFEGRSPIIYTYTSEDGWVALETTVDWESGRATTMTRYFSTCALFGADVEEVEEIAVETPVLEFTPVTGVEIPGEDDTGFGYLNWIAGIGFILMLGLIVTRRKRDEGGL